MERGRGKKNSLRVTVDGVLFGLNSRVISVRRHFHGRAHHESQETLHDAIVGLLVTVGVALGHYVSAHWLLLPAVIGVTLIQSYVTGFCPVYFALDRLLPSEGAADAPSFCAK